MYENRLIVRLNDYWNRLKKDDVLPDFKKNNPAMIEDLWQQCFVLSIVPTKFPVYKYEFLGDKVKAVYGRDITGTVVDLNSKQFPNSIISPKLKKIVELAEINQPLEEQGQTPSKGSKFIKYRMILLPFGNEGAGLTHIVAGLSFREF